MGDAGAVLLHCFDNSPRMPTVCLPKRSGEPALGRIGSGGCYERALACMPCPAYHADGARDPRGVLHRVQLTKNSGQDLHGEGGILCFPSQRRHHLERLAVGSFTSSADRPSCSALGALAVCPEGLQ